MWAPCLRRLQHEGRVTLSERKGEEREEGRKGGRIGGKEEERERGRRYPTLHSR